MTNFFDYFEYLLFKEIKNLGVEINIPVIIDVGDEGFDIEYAAGVVRDDENQQLMLMFNAVSPWWRTDIEHKMKQTVRHEVRHLFQREKLRDIGFSETECDRIMNENGFGGYLTNPFEVDARAFEVQLEKDVDENLEWIEMLIECIE